MERLIVEGGYPLHGEIEVGGAKNHALKVVAAAVLSKEPWTITNIPKIADIMALLEIIRQLGGQVEWTGEHTVVVSGRDITEPKLDPVQVRKLRASVVLLGPLLARFGEVKFPHPGGCVIGQRPIDIFLDGFQALGIQVTEDDEYYHFISRQIVGTTYVFPRISVTATETLMLAATLAEGTTVLKFAACEPEIQALAEFLNSVGARISGAGTHTITIQGVTAIGGGTAAIIPDRIEAGTFAILAAATGGQIIITHCDPLHLEVPWKVLRQAGVTLDIGRDRVTVRAGAPLTAVNLITHEYPGFVTDLQAPFTVLMTQAKGLSLIHETIYEGRLFFIDKLVKMGANIIMCDPHRVVVLGPVTLHGGKLESPDIRAGMSLVIAALIAEGKSQIENIYQIDRGYENIDRRLQSLGAHIRREDT